MTALRRHLLFALIALAIASINLSTLRDVLSLSQRDDTASHLLLVPLVSLALVWLDRAVVFASVRTSPAGAAILGGGLAVQAAAALGGGSLTAAALAMVVQWIGAFTLVYGVAAAGAARFALLFLALVAPFPAVLITAGTSILKAGSAEAVAVLFSLTGAPHHRTGYIFELPRLSIEIADECSGIRSSIALVLTSLLAGHMFLARGWGRALLVLAVLPITILKNGFRIVGLSLLATYVDPSFLTGRLHHDGGIAFFLVALGMMVPVLAICRRLETAPRPSPVWASRLFDRFILRTR
jgi:exosortase